MRKIILILMFFLIFTSFVPLNAQWASSYGEIAFEEPRCILQTNDSGYIITGRRSSLFSDSDIWILKLDSTGYIEWQRRYGGSSGEDAYSIQQTSDGGYIVAGDI